MADIPFYSKLEFIQLMEQKRGLHFTMGWLKMAYAMPPVDEATEQEIIQKEMETLLQLPNFEVDTALAVV